MIAEILANALGGILNEVFNGVFKQPLQSMLDERSMNRALIDAVNRAEATFARDYHAIDPELTNALISQTRFADVPSVQAALKDMLAHPFHDPSQSVVVLKRSFHDVLPERTDRTRVDQAVTTFLHYLGQEVLYITQLQHLYALAFQKVSAENSRVIASNTAAIVESMRDLREDIQQLPAALNISALPVSREQELDHSHPLHNLPQRPYTHFVGREAELQKLTQLMLPYPRSRHFLVTVDGIGGVGKSALALELAYFYRDSYHTLPPEERFEAIVWISAKRTLLTASGIQQRQQTFSTLSDLYHEIAIVLEVPSIMQIDPEQRRALVEHTLSSKRTLLIVDNLETVDDEEVLTFLHELPDPTKAIVTTRHRIDIAYAIRLSGMSHTDALALIQLEAQQKNVDFRANNTEDLYRRTGGIPLAIVWSIALMSLGYGMESVLRRLGSSHSDIAHFCFTESIAQIRGKDSYRLLLALALFESSVNREMLGKVAGLGEDEVGRDDALAELLQLSLINQEGDRFTLLPLTRSFALEELAQQPELEQALRENWIEYFTDFSQPYKGWHWLGHGLKQVWQEGKHLVTLASWCQEVERLDVLLKILPALGFYLDMMGQWADMLILGKIALEYAQLIGDNESIVFLEAHNLSWVLSQQGHHEAAEHYLNDALQIARQIGDITWQCEILVIYSQALRRRREFDKVFDCCRQALDLSAQLTGTDQKYVRATIDYELGKYHRDLGNWQEARTIFMTTRDVFRNDENDSVFNKELAWGVLSNLGFIEHQLGNLDVAEQMYLQSLAFFSELGSRGNMATLLVRLAILEEQRGNVATSLEYAQEAQDLIRRLGMVQEQVQVEVLFERLANVQQIRDDQ
jgi:tetratricopeptide (TPR) repeat protein